MQTLDFSQFAYAFGQPLASGQVRTVPEDFQVDEILGFAPDGEGEHFMLHVRKRNANTEWVAKRLAEFCWVKPQDVSYAGMKDRYAVATQWFSVRLPKGPEPVWPSLENPEFEILQAVRHSRKLRRGALRGNRFVLTVRNLQGDPAELEQRLARVAQRGVPNYFGLQRFGRAEDNLTQSRALFAGELKVKDPHKRSLYLSAARSFLFNLVLSQRVTDNTWDQALAGDVMQLDGSHSVFKIEQPDEEIARRLAQHDIHPTGPLWGKGDLASKEAAAALESAILDAHPDLQRGLERFGLEQERRALRLPAKELAWAFPEPGVLRLEFHLPAGAYASSVLREVAEISDV